MAAGIAAAGLLLDSNILIDLLRGEAQALAWIEAHAGATSISVISWMEILVGCYDDESRCCESWPRSFRRLELTQAIALQQWPARRSLARAPQTPSSSPRRAAIIWSWSTHHP